MQQTAVLTSLLVIQSMSSQNLPKLLSSQISDAKCLSKCLSVPTLPEMTQCYEACKILQQNPSSDLCQFPQLCGEGCTAACQDDLQPGEVDQAKFEYFYRHSCQLTWRIKIQTMRNVVFIVAGQDQGGMWHLVAGNVTRSKLVMTASFGTKYPTVAVMAVDSETVLDTLVVNIPLYQECGEEERNAVTVIDDDLISVIILSVVVVTLFIILLAILCCKRSPQDGVRLRHTNHLESRKQIFPTKHKQKFDNFDGRKSMQMAEDNTYVDFPHFYEDVA